MRAKRLGRDGFERARRFLASEARPLEGALFAFRFEGASAQGVREELARFGNDDGGFGHALEPDVGTPSSSALATALALRILAELDVPADDPLVSGAVEWAIASLDERSLVWRVVPEDANDHPHAPWWHDEDGSLARTFDDFGIIPRALLVGLLHRFGRTVPADLTEATVRCIESAPVLGQGGGSDLEYAVHLARTDALPERYRERLTAKIRESIPQSVVRDPARWSSYCITPLRAAPAPDSIGADLIEADLSRNLDFLIDRQSPDGAWDPTWSSEYPPEWRGVLTLEALTTLRVFGRA